MTLSLASMIAASFGFAAFGVMAIDIVYLRSFYFLKSYKSTFTTLLRCSGFFAVFHALAALVPESAVFFTNVASVCKVLWVYCYLGLMLTNFNPHGHGGMRENIEVAGGVLESAKFPELKNPICCIPCTGQRYYTPNTEWIDNCVSRVKIYLWGEIVTVIVTQVLEDQKLLFTEDGSPKLADRLMRLVGVMFVLCGVSGFMLLRPLLRPLLHPEAHHHVVARAVLSTVFFTWIGGLQNALLSLCGFHQNTNYAVINVEMFFFQIFCHKFYVPNFSWGFDPPNFASAEDSKQKLSDYKFLIPIEDMAATVNRKKKRTDYRKAEMASDVEAVGEEKTEQL